MTRLNRLLSAAHQQATLTFTSFEFSSFLFLPISSRLTQFPPRSTLTTSLPECLKKSRKKHTHISGQRSRKRGSEHFFFN